MKTASLPTTLVCSECIFSEASAIAVSLEALETVFSTRQPAAADLLTDENDFFAEFKGHILANYYMQNILVRTYVPSVA